MLQAPVGRLQMVKTICLGPQALYRFLSARFFPIFSSAVFALLHNYELYAWKRLSVNSSDFEITETGGRGELVDPGVTMIVAIVTSQRTNRGNTQNSQK